MLTQPTTERTEPRRSRRRRVATSAAVALAVVVLLGACQPLTNLDPVEYHGHWRTGGITMNAVDFSQALAFSSGGTVGCGGTGHIEYDLGRSYKTFTATVGVRDDTSSTRRYDYRILVDGAQRASGTVKLGTNRKVDVSVDGALRLRIEASRRCSGSGTYGRIGFGSPLLGR